MLMLHILQRGGRAANSAALTSRGGQRLEVLKGTVHPKIILFTRLPASTLWIPVTFSNPHNHPSSFMNGENSTQRKSVVASGKTQRASMLLVWRHQSVSTHYVFSQKRSAAASWSELHDGDQRHSCPCLPPPRSFCVKAERDGERLAERHSTQGTRSSLKMSSQRKERSPCRLPADLVRAACM